MERKLFKEELEAFQEVLDKYEEGGSVTVIQYQVFRGRICYYTFRKNQSELNEIDEDQTQDERLALKYKFLESKTRATDIIENAKRRLNNDVALNSIKLPKIQLPSFSGS